MNAHDIVASMEKKGSEMSTSSRSGDVSFKLSIRQQPKTARACGFGDYDRRTIDPPPIIQLDAEGPDSSESKINPHLRYHGYVMLCFLLDESGSRDVPFIHGRKRSRNKQLVGHNVSTAFVGKDDRGDYGCFFVFDDLSCRTNGEFRLRFWLTRVNQKDAQDGQRIPYLAGVQSDVFVVYTAEGFPGMQASTELATCLKNQGCTITTRKGHNLSKNAGEKKRTSGEEQDDDEGDM